jgi:hypothetical protein
LPLIERFRVTGVAIAMRLLRGSWIERADDRRGAQPGEPSL